MSAQEPTESTAAPSTSTEEAAVQVTEAGTVPEEEFLAAIRSAKGCVTEQEVPCDLTSVMSAELVEWRRGQWYPTGQIVSNHTRWGVRVRFTYYGNLALCLCGRLKITAWWDGFSNLPEGHKDAYIDVDPCKTPHQYEVVIVISSLRCPQDAGVYDLAATLDFICCGREAIVLGHCDLEAIRVTC
jgi:hypothetical protein